MTKATHKNLFASILSLCFLITGFVVWAAPSITLHGSYPSRATVGPDTSTNGDCGHPGIDCSGSTITVLADYFPEVGNHFRYRATIEGATGVIIQSGNFTTGGNSFMNWLSGNSIERIEFPSGSLQQMGSHMFAQAFRQNHNVALQDIYFPEGSPKVVGESFMQDFMYYASGVALTGITFPSGSLTSIGDYFMNGFMLNTNNTNLESLIFPDNSMPDGGDQFMQYFMEDSNNQTKLSIQFGENSLSTVGDYFMFEFMAQVNGGVIDELIFPSGSLIQIGAYFLYDFMEATVDSSLETITFATGSFQSGTNFGSPGAPQYFMEAFMNGSTNAALESLEFPDDSLTTIGEYAFLSFMAESNDSNFNNISFGQNSLQNVHEGFMTYFMGDSDNSALMSLSFPEGSFKNASGYFMGEFMNGATNAALDSISFPASIFSENVETWDMFVDFNPNYPITIYGLLGSEIATLAGIDIETLLPGVDIFSKIESPYNVTTSESNNTIRSLSINNNDVIRIRSVVENTSAALVTKNAQLLFNQTESIDIPASGSGTVERYYKVFDVDGFKATAQ